MSKRKFVLAHNTRDGQAHVNAHKMIMGRLQLPPFQYFIITPISNPDHVRGLAIDAEEIIITPAFTGAPGAPEVLQSILPAIMAGASK